MTKIEAKIEKDSLTPTGSRLTTFVLTYPRFIHGEMMTHRVFSRNASSSRAIPLKTQIEELKKDVASPLQFRENQKGMQAFTPLSKEDEEKAQILWKLAAENAIKSAELINSLVPNGVHKQYLNRLLEPFSYITVIVSSTEYENFFKLRNHPDAQPEIAALAKKMEELYRINKPEILNVGQWHLPFVTKEEEKSLSFEEQIQKSVACCARVSYNNHDGSNPTSKQNKGLYDRLSKANPPHLSPFEHQGVSTDNNSHKSGNFVGWIQHRQILK